MWPGGIRLTDAQIGTDLLINMLVVHSDRMGRSIAADGLSVAQDLQAEMIESHGEVSLRAARIGVSMSLSGSTAAQPRRTAGAERPAAHGGAHALSDGRRSGPGRRGHRLHSAVRYRFDPAVRHPPAAVRMQRRGAARRRAVR